MAPGALERLLKMLPARAGASAQENRVLAGRARNEDAVVISVPAGKALVQSVDILTPLVDDAFAFGRIAAANALSDIYALGGQPWSAMNIACFPACGVSDDMEQTLGQILCGGLYALNEAGAVLAGGHTVVDDQLKYGLAVTGIIDPALIATNDGLQVGDALLLTKPIGTGILVTGIKARWEDWEVSQSLLCDWCARLNKAGAAVIQQLRLKAATDITG
ncbi:MAG: selenide, water dikinase SelD, partial [Desulfovibrionaceae bacterium]